jgi:hypothetical protein
MLHSFVTAASEIAGEEPSKTAFYVMGGVLALWAVVVSALGIARHDDFPSSDGAARGVMGITVVLVAAAMATAVITA